MRVAVVGSGIAGLGAAHLLDRAHDVTVFERDLRAGGHTHTIRHDGLALDTGFLVHNARNYPLLGRLFAELGVRTQESQMSFSVGCAACGLEYSGRRPFAQRRSLASPRFAALLWEIGRWLRTARRSLEDADYEAHSLRAYLDEHGYSNRFRRHFLVPLTSALWSTAPGRALEFPAAHAIRFFDNHGMLGLRRFAWRTVSGGSDTYVRALSERLGPRLHLGLGVRSLRRDADGVELTTDDGERRRFDKAVVATHADQALALLEDPDEDERRVLGAFAYTRNEASSTPTSGCSRAPVPRAPSWNYRLGDDGRPTITYSLESVAIDRRGNGVLRDAEPAGRRRARDPPPHLRAPALHGRRPPRAARAARACRARVTSISRAPTTATASTRTASPPGFEPQPSSG